MTDATHLFAPISYIAKGGEAGETRIVYGILTNPTVDIDKQKVDPTWVKGALSEWFTNWGNIRAMHRPDAVGKALELHQDGDDWFLTSEIVDHDAILKLDKGIYKGYSLGMRWPKLRYNDPEAPMGTICGGKIVESSLVDHPCNETSKFVLGKSALADVEAETEEQAEELVKAAGEADTKGAVKATSDYTDADGPFADTENKKWPLGNKAHVRAALSYYNAGKGKDGYAGDAWLAMGKKIATAANKFFGSGHTVEAGAVKSNDGATKAAESAQDELTDAQLATQALDLVKQLIAREAGELADDDDLDDLYDVLCLSNVAESLNCFIAGEAREAAELFAAPKAADADLTKAGRRNSAADLGHLQAAHDHLGSLGAKASDACLPNADAPADDNGGRDPDFDGDNDMDEKAVQAQLTKAIEALDIPSTVKDAVNAALEEAGIAEIRKAAEAQPQVPDIEALVKGAVGDAVAALDGRMRDVEERATDTGPLAIGIERTIKAAQVDTRKAALAQQVAELKERSTRHPDPIVRAQAYRDYSTTKRELDALN